MTSKPVPNFEPFSVKKVTGNKLKFFKIKTTNPATKKKIPIVKNQSIVLVFIYMTRTDEMIKNNKIRPKTFANG